ncbi:MAG: ABC transporter substrate-binding protein [Bacteroidia bacterium]|nr:ABC transporter substrate-binding protein [Bacteroidia bacterium]
MRGWRGLLVGMLLIAAAGAALLLTDRSGRRAVQAATARRVAIIQASSIPAFDLSARGVIAALEAAGYTSAGGSELRRFNAEADLGTLNQLCSEVANAPFDLVVTIGTTSGQAFMRANKRSLPHVFGVVADPASLGVALGEWREGARPPNVTGMGALIDLPQLLDALRASAPHVRTIGTMWNPSEANADLYAKRLLAEADRRGLKVISASASDAAGILEAATGVMAQPIDCLVFLPDTSVTIASPTILQAAQKRKVPVIGTFPESVDGGSILNLGMDWAGIGTQVGEVAARVLGGTPPSEIPVVDRPKMAWTVNLASAAAFGWSVPQSIVDGATIVIAADGSRREKRLSTPRVQVIAYSNAAFTDEVLAGIRDGFIEQKLAPGEGIELSVVNAQGDMSTLNQLVVDSVASQPAVIMSISTPSLQALLKRNDRIPCVFTTVFDPYVTGVGTEPTKHHPLFTGVTSHSDFPRLIEVVRATWPGAKRLGTVYCPSEDNSVAARDELATLAKAAGMDLISSPAERGSDMATAAEAVISQGIDVFTQISDNIASGSFPVVGTVCDRARLPLVGTLTRFINEGAVIVVARDYHLIGVQGAEKAASILRGADPATIPIEDPRTSLLLLNEGRAKQLGVTLPASIERQLDRRVP